MEGYGLHSERYITPVNGSIPAIINEMSLKDQIAMGKNTQLQRKFEETCTGYKKALRLSRRRLDNVEEECVASLYKLLIDAKEHQASSAPPTGEVNNTSHTAKARRAQSAGPMNLHRSPANRPEQSSEIYNRPRRPASTMPVRNYVQSYSFMKDGLDISRHSKERYVKSKQHEAEAQQQVVIDRRHVRRPSTSMDRPQTSASQYIGERNEGTTTQRPVTCGPHSTQSHNKLTDISRPQQTRNHVNNGNINDEDIKTEQTEDSNNLKSVKSTVDEYKDQQNSKLQIENGSNQENPNRAHCTVQENVTDDEEHTRAVKLRKSDFPDNKANRSPHSSAGNSDASNGVAPENVGDVTVTPLNTHEEENLTKITTKCPNNNNIIRSKSAVFKSHTEKITPVRNFKSRLSTYDVIPSDNDNTLKESTKKTHNFLTQYAKKSKLFGYVVNATASSTAPRNKNKKVYRSPCVTYQELVSIKANIKRHNTQTRMLLLQSEQIKNYVWRLSNGYVYREFKASGQ